MVSTAGSALSTQHPALATFTVHRYCFVLEVLPGPPLLTFEHKGSALRGVLLRRLHARFCLQPFVRGANGCMPCHQPQACPIAFLAGTKADEFDPESQRGDDLPRPFALEPELSTLTVYQPGESFSFGITLFGRANTLLPYIMGAVEGFDDNLSRSGLDGGRGRLGLREVWAEQPISGTRTLVWQPGSRMALPNLGVSLSDIETGAAHELTIFFKTPTTIKHQGQLLHGSPPLAALVQRLLERITSLLDLLTDDRPPLPFHELTQLAHEVRIVADPAELLPARWVDLERYSSTHGYKHPIGGIVGRVRYAGDLTPFLPWLTFGQWLHVGKNAAQGNGMYVVERVES